MINGNSDVMRSSQLRVLGVIGGWRFTILLFNSILLMAIVPACASGFRVVGEMEYWKGTNIASNVPDNHWSFEAWELGKQWLEKVGIEEDKTVVLGSDGYSVYQVFVDGIGKKQLHMNAYPGSVFNGTYPVQSYGFNTIVPWLAYCSASLISGNTNGQLNLPAPWLMPWQDPLAYIYKCHFKLLPDGAGLPALLEYQPDKDLMQAFKEGHYGSLLPPSIETRQRIEIQISGRYSKIFEPEAVYQVVQTTNLFGVTLPTMFSFTRYVFINNKEDVFQRTISSVTRGKVISIEPIDNIDPIPKTQDDVTNIDVADYRFFDSTNRVAFVAYVATNSTWLTNQSDPYLQSLYAKAIKKTSSAHSFIIPERPIVLGLLVLSVCSPLFFPFVRREIFNLFKK
jgi:hypothetical protein